MDRRTWGRDGVWAGAVIDDQVFYAPEFVPVEATNVLRRLELAEQIDTAEASGAQEDLTQFEIEQFAIEQFAVEPFSGRIWRLRHTVAGYDVWCVAVAGERAYSFATLDRRLAKMDGLKCGFLAPDSQ